MSERMTGGSKMKRRLDKLVLWRSVDTGQWYWHLQSAYNGLIKASGQSSGFASKDKALRGWEAVAKSGQHGVVITVDQI